MISFTIYTHPLGLIEKGKIAITDNYLQEAEFIYEEVYSQLKKHLKTDRFPTFLKQNSDVCQCINTSVERES